MANNEKPFAVTVEAPRTAPSGKPSSRSRTDSVPIHATAFAHSFDAIILTDEGGACVDLNPAACALFGCAVTDVRRKPFWAIAGSDNEDELRALWSSAVPSAGIERSLSLRQHGADVALRARISGGQCGFAVLFHSEYGAPCDETVAALRTELDDAHRQREGILSLVSHDVRSPLGVLVGALKELTHPAVGTLTPDQQMLARLMERSSQRLARFASSLVELARADAGRLDLALRPIDLRSVIDQAIETERKVEGEKSVTFEWVPPLDAVVAAIDRERFVHILANLLGNAKRFAKTHVVVRLGSDDDQVLVSVEDDGSGIPPALLPLLFHPWRRADPRNGRSSSGIGLGLVRGLVEAHRGTVVAENLPPQTSRGGAAAVAASGGARFTVRLPRVSAGPAPAPLRSLHQKLQRPRKRRALKGGAVLPTAYAIG